MERVVKTILFGIVFSVLTVFSSFAAESIAVSGGTVTYTIDVTGCGTGKGVSIYILMNGAAVDVRGAQASNYSPRSNHIKGSAYYDMSVAFGNGTNKTSPTWYTINSSGVRTMGVFASSISCSCSLVNGRLVATVVIVDPIREVSGICFVKRSSSGRDTYYDKIGGGEKDITEAVLKARGEYVEPTQPAPEETEAQTSPEIGPGIVPETRTAASGEEEERFRAEEEARRLAEEEAKRKAEEESKRAEERAKKASEISDIRSRIRSSESESSKVKDTEIPCRKLKELAGAIAELF